jgi:hypothetical protein
LAYLGFHSGDIYANPTINFYPSILSIPSPFTMDYSEKRHDGSSGDIAKAHSGSNHAEFYDPSKESIWTRLGVNAESFKRAPGTTGLVIAVLVG